MTMRDYHKQIENGVEYTIAVEGYLTEWYVNHKLHRENGPAYVYCYGGILLQKWYYHGESIPFEFSSKEEYERKLKLSAFW